MRILSLGFPVPGASIDNHTFVSAPSFFDYDAIVVDPHALSELIEGIVGGTAARTRSAEQVVNGQDAPDTISLGTVLRERRDQTARLLARGGIVVCFAYPNVAHDIAGLADGDNYCWLPPPEGIDYSEPFLRRGEGAEIQPSATVAHPFVPFLQRMKSRFAYRAYFEGAAECQVLARSAGGAAVAVELAAGGGRIVFLPPPAQQLAGDALYEASSALQEALRQMLGLAEGGPAPDWIEDYDLPAVESTPDQTEAGTPDHRALLWREGRYGLDESVRAALTVLGFHVYGDDVDQPATISYKDERYIQHSALLEVDASVEAVGLGGHYRLRQRIEDAIASGKPAAGVLIVNGYRRTPPAERPAQYSDELRIAAERFRYCIATTEQLYHAVRAALAGDEVTVKAFRERLLTTEGILHEN